MKRILIAILAMLLIIPTTVGAVVPGQNSREDIRTDAEIIAKVMYEECRGVKSTTRKAAVAWCILNRVDDVGHPDTVEVVAKQSNQFAWNPSAPVTEELLALAEDVLLRWQLEKVGMGDVGRVLPQDFRWFSGDGEENYFRNAYRGGERWDWSLESPYES